MQGFCLSIFYVHELAFYIMVPFEYTGAALTRNASLLSQALLIITKGNIVYFHLLSFAIWLYKKFSINCQVLNMLFIDTCHSFWRLFWKLCHTKNYLQFFFSTTRYHYTLPLMFITVLTTFPFLNSRWVWHLKWLPCHMECQWWCRDPGATWDTLHPWEHLPCIQEHPGNSRFSRSLVF